MFVSMIYWITRYQNKKYWSFVSAFNLSKNLSELLFWGKWKIQKMYFVCSHEDFFSKFWTIVSNGKKLGNLCTVANQKLKNTLMVKMKTSFPPISPSQIRRTVIAIVFNKKLSKKLMAKIFPIFKQSNLTSEDFKFSKNDPFKVLK